MKKPIFVVIAFLVVAAAMIPAYANIPSTGMTWLGTANHGSKDPYYNQNMNVSAYEENTTAVLAVTVTNASSGKWSSNTINVTSIYVSFDWGSTYYSTQVSASNPMLVNNNVTGRVIFVNFTVPDTKVASNLFRHTYTVFVNYQYANKSATYQTLKGTFQYTAQDFVVYSTDQADAQNLAGITASYPDLSKLISSSNLSAEAQILWNDAANETATAARYYQQGNFPAAKQSYSNALNDKNQAWAAEQSYLTVLQDLQTQKTQAEIASMNAYASFLNGFSTLWVLLGIGWVLLDIGYIIKWLRAKRPEAPAAPALEILKERYAKGEITKEQYESMMRELS